MTALPPQLERLHDLALNLHWCWHYQAIDLFRRLAPQLWEATNHNPILLLEQIDEDALRACAEDAAYLADLEAALASLTTYLAGGQTWFDTTGLPAAQRLIAYFSMEFGLHESLPIYSGGLGVLAGDHLKSSSDLGLPLIGVGILYQDGYFRQFLDDSGWQQEGDEQNTPRRLPVTSVTAADGTPLQVSVGLPGRQVQVRAWLVRVGRVNLYLLDTNLADNTDQDRQITARLYGGDVEMRIQQEIVLGIGGYRLLEALEIDPHFCHMNEGHAAFLALERIRSLMQRKGLTFAEARDKIRPNLAFTTHTPVAAGHDYFSPDLMERYFGDYVGGIGLSMYELLGLGRHNPDDYREYFCMTIMALKLAAHSNGVSRLHGAVSRAQWKDLWPGRPVEEVPIGSITNGVHLPSFVAPAMAALYERHLGIKPGTAPTDPAVWEPILRVPDAELWAVREACRANLLAYIETRVDEQNERHHRVNGDGFDPAALTIGFARRFATYKRASLLLRDPERLARILNRAGRPVQIIFAGKAHPRDEGGKALIQRIAGLAGDETFRHRIVFLEGYDLGVARQLVRGVDVWLNTPQRPYEASGTSGMKAAANGALNCSTLDGWWVEAWDESQRRGGAIGWAIGGTQTYDDPEYQADQDAQSLYAILEQELVPAFYERGLDGIPYGWTARMKRSIAQIAPVFNTDRMVREYAENIYLK
ncbi:MAG TPA: alpha-glucan family phosphorylase [Thermomicrobiales bacterium]|nr:alpha-glucan family phosphorylase [Thermomicrobiales bacterium]